MNGKKSPEYRAFANNRYDLEKQLSNRFVPIARKLRDKELLSDDLCDSICDAGKDGPNQLITEVLSTIEFSVNQISTFFKVVEVMRESDTPGFSDYIEAAIEGRRKEIYREKLKESGSDESQEWDVFISYGQEDKTNAVVDEIATSLKEKGLKVFVDRSALKPGAIWSAEMVGAIHKCRAFIAVLTKKYARSSFCHGELYEAEACEKQIYGVKLEQDWESQSGSKPVAGIVLRRQYIPWNKENLKKLVDTITDKQRPTATASTATGTGAMIPQAQPYSFEALCSQYGLTMDVFNEEISDNHILDIYPQLDRWEEIAARLGISKPDRDAIEHKATRDVKLMKMYMLQQWKNKGLIFGTATYRVLIEALWMYECHATVKQICQLLQRE